MKILVCLENLKMDGCHRATIVVGNGLSKYQQVTFYSLSSEPSYFNLEAPLAIARRPYNSGKSFHEADPLSKLQNQLNDLIFFIQQNNVDTIILTAGLLSSFAPKIKHAVPHAHIIAWMHNNFETYYYQYYSEMLTEFLAGISAVDHLIVLTEHDLQHFRHYNEHTEKIYNPIALEVSANSRAPLKSTVISAVGRLDIQHKGWDILLEIAKTIPPNWQIQLAGDGPDKTILQKEISQNGLKRKFMLLGNLNDSDLFSFYMSSSIFLATSRWEGLPLVIGEAMNFGLPIVSTPNTGAQEYLQNGSETYGLMSANFNSNSLTKILRPLFNSYNCRSFWGAKAKKRSQDFKFDNLISKWNHLLLSSS